MSSTKTGMMKIYRTHALAHLTHSWLALQACFGRMCRMNGFRVTILVLLCLAVGLMFYVVAYMIPAQQEAYEAYRAAESMDAYNQRAEEHRQRMQELDPDHESDAVAEARAAAEKAQQERLKKLTEAEESSVLADARRKQEESMAKQTEVEVADSKPIGLVASYNQEWNSVLFKPVTKSPINVGLVVALRRDNNIICEAEVDNVDPESGQVSAQIKPSSFNNTAGGAVQDGILPEEKMPAVGDEVIITPFETVRDLREDNYNFGAPVPTGAAPLPQDDGTEVAVPMSDDGLEPLPMP